MNDLKILEEFGTTLDTPSPEPPVTLRQRVIRGIHPPPRNERRHPYRLTAALGGGLALATAAVVVITQLVAAPPRAAAEEILDRAASYAQQRQSAESDQFLYLESLTANLTGPVVQPATGQLKIDRRQVWLSVDGTRDGLIRSRPVDGRNGGDDLTLPGCIDGKAKVRKGPDVIITACTPTPAYTSGLPDDPAAMLALLRQQGAGTKNPVDDETFRRAGELLREASLAPATMAAVFRALSEVSGTTVINGVTDEAGRTGTAVSKTLANGTRIELIFDPTTSAYLGQRTIATRDYDEIRAGQVLDSSALVKIGIVDHARQLP